MRPTEAVTVTRYQDIPSTGRSGALAFLFFAAVFFPYIQLVPLPTDTQPYAMLLGIGIFLGASRRSLPPEIALLFFVLLFSLLLIPFGGDALGAIRSIANYASLFFISFGTYFLLKIRGGFPVGALRWTIWIWFFVGLIQVTVYRDFLVPLIGRGFGWGGSAVRGVVSLSPEPSHYGMFCVLVLVLLMTNRMRISGREVSFLGLLLLIQILLFARSAMAAVMLALLATLIVVTSVFSPRRFTYVLVLSSIVALTLWGLVALEVMDLEGSRMWQLTQALWDNPWLVVLTDASVNDRMMHIYFSFLGFVENWGLPHGYGRWDSYLAAVTPQYSEMVIELSGGRIMSAYGAAVFELGVPGLLVPLAITIAIVRYYRSSPATAVTVSLFLHAVLLTAVPLATPLVGLLVGYFAYHSRVNPTVAIRDAAEHAVALSL